MKKVTCIIFAATFALIFATAALADHHAVKIVKKAGVGNYLTDAKGMTLYWFVKDSAGESACMGGCLEKWPAYYRAEVAPQEGISAEDFATITRSDGQKQTTFRGYPLYYFFKDNMAGDTKGQGIKKVWYVVDPADFPKH